MDNGTEVVNHVDPMHGATTLTAAGPPFFVYGFTHRDDLAAELVRTFNVPASVPQPRALPAPLVDGCGSPFGREWNAAISQEVEL